MAKKKKKINRTLLIVLIAFAAIVVVGAVVWEIHRMPGDPEAEVRKGNALASEGKWDAAAHILQKAVNDSAHTDKEAATNLAFVNFFATWLEKDKSLTREKRSQVQRNRLDKLETVLRIDSTNEAAQRLLSDFYWSEVQYSGSRQEICQLFLEKSQNQLSLTPNDKELHHRRAKAFAVVGQIKPEALQQAADEYTKVIALEPGNALMWKEYIDFCAQVKKDEVEKVCQAALQANPDSVLLHAQYAEHLKENGQSGEAELQFKKALTGKCQSVEDYIALVAYYHGLVPPQMDKAIETAKQAQQMAPTDSRSYSVLADLLVQQKQAPAAADALREGLKNVEALRDGKPEGELLPETREKYLNSLLSLHAQLAGLMLFRNQSEPEQHKKNVEEAKASIAILDQKAPQWGQTVKLKGRLALEQGDMLQAEQLLRKVFDSGGESPDPEVAAALVGIYRQQDQLGEADQILERICTAFPNSVDALLQRVQLQLAFHKTDIAIELLKQAKRLNPTGEKLDQFSRLQMVALEQRGGKVPEVKIPQVIKEEDITNLLWYAGKLTMDGDTGKAETYYLAILKQWPKQPRAAAALAGLYVATKQDEKAKVALREAIALNPDDARLKLLSAIMSTSSEPERERLMLDDIKSRTEGADRETEMAAFYRGRGKMDECQKHLEAALAIDKGSLTAVEQLFNIYILQNQLDKAEALCPVAKEKDLDGAGGQVYLARIQLARKQFDEAIATIQNVLNSRGPFSLGQVLLGEAYQGKGDLDAAMTSFNTSYQQDPANVVAVVGLAQITERKKLTDQHEQWVQLAVKLGSNNPYIISRWQQILDKREKSGEAIRRREKLASDYEEAADANSERMAVQNLLILSSLYEKEDPPENAKAEAIYKQLVERMKGKDGAIDFVRIYADFLARTQRAQDGAALLQQALDTYPDKVASRLQTGAYLLMLGDAVQAEKFFKDAMTIDAKDPRSYRALSQLYENAGKWDTAMENLRKYLELKPEDKQAGWDLIRYEINGKKPQDAIAQLEKILADNPKDSRALGMMGLAQLSAGQTAKAREYLDKAIESNPQDVSLRIYRSSMNLATDALMEAAKDLEEAYRLSPTPDIVQRLANVYRRQGDVSKERTLLQEAAGSHPDNQQFIQMLAGFYIRTQDWRLLNETLTLGKKLTPKDPSWYLMEVEMCSNTRDVSRQIAAAAKAYEIDSKDNRILTMYVQALLEGKQYAKAVEIATPGLQRPELQGQMQAMIARATYGLGKQKEADEGFKKSYQSVAVEEGGVVTDQLFRTVGEPEGVKLLSQWLGESPNTPMGMALGRYYMKKSNWPQAKDALEKAASSTTNAKARGAIASQLGVVLSLLGDYPGAQKAYTERLAQEPNDIVVLNNMAFLVAENLNNPKDALPYAQRAAELAPTDYNVSDTLGWIRCLNGDLQEARDVLEKSIQMKQASSNRYHLGQVLERMGRKDEAKHQYELGYDLVKDDPKDEFYAQLKERHDAIVK